MVFTNAPISRELSQLARPMSLFGTSQCYHKNKMSDTAGAVKHERTTILIEYIGFRPSWSSNMELILRWDVCISGFRRHEALKDIL